MLEGDMGDAVLRALGGSVDAEEGGDEGGPDDEGHGLGGQPGEASDAVG